MLQWIAMAVLTAAASLAILAPLYRARIGGAAERAAAAVYRDQLAEIDRDVARGIVTGDEAAAARAEIGRRLIKEATAGDAPPARGGDLRLAVLAAAVGVPLAAVALYLALGEPSATDSPLAARQNLPLEQQDEAILLARIEAHLASAPDDGEGWAVVAPVYSRIGRHDDAVRAYSNAIRILGPDADRESGLGEAITAANGGVVTNEARQAFERALALAPGAVRPRFYLALARGQDGDTAAAIAAWRALLADAPPEGAPWVEAARAELARLAGQAAPGPTQDDVAAAAALGADERAAMIEGMVASLAERLASQPNDPEGWMRLIRSYAVLGRTSDAAAALARARQIFAGDAARQADLAALARSLGLAEREGG
jgi:cytochrome c-type biogenesis protein CcmH